ncbi:Predicted methyltransferase [Nannocystis exedens]|uniref:Predicted methyltransferase n=1 Tax=Nannocystis exedens TaxID=54 RepID=A0A1I1ZFN5_9BACT|nr:class I SAM-dependent methyltransferase [Nannocystis exedens]PCC75055.1 methyltransferase [Nannocystis exedens]SFE29130.1 Predicted methyltransferase [Nannocystis exedens]
MFLRTALRSLSLTALVTTTVLPGCASKPAAPAETPAPGGEDPAAAAVRDADPATVEALKAAIAGPQRSAENRARDQYRHPLETLLFFGLKKDMTVVELWPGGGGWFTEILAPTLRDSGKLIVTNFDTSGPPDAYQTRSGNKFKEKLAGAPEVYDKVEVVTVTDPSALVLAPENSVDLVVTFRNTHGWVEDGIDAAIYGAAFKALKPGGVLGVEAHRAKPQPVDDPKKIAATGYLPEDWVVARIESFGFKLQARSEINANPKDTKDYEKGVWTLPPSFELGDKDRDKYAAIGESDRMTLKFVKP